MTTVQVDIKLTSTQNANWTCLRVLIKIIGYFLLQEFIYFQKKIIQWAIYVSIIASVIKIKQWKQKLELKNKRQHIQNVQRRLNWLLKTKTKCENVLGSLSLKMSLNYTINSSNFSLYTFKINEDFCGCRELFPFISQYSKSNRN